MNTMDSEETPGALLVSSRRLSNPFQNSHALAPEQFVHHGVDFVLPVAHKRERRVAYQAEKALTKLSSLNRGCG